ncbi:MAG TPA: hypothetical protein VIQ97_06310, partial [Prevotella sp.]
MNKRQTKLFNNFLKFKTMKKNNLLANVASKALALAAVMMMSMAFTACSSDDDDTPQPEQTPNSVTIDGKIMPVTAAFYEDNDNGNFTVYLQLSDGSYFDIEGNATDHIGKTIDLTKKEGDKVDGIYNWYVEYIKNRKTLFRSFGGNEKDNRVFTTGTLRIDGNPVGGETTI